MHSGKKMKNEKEEFITIGQIAAPFGCYGQMKVVPYTDFPHRFLKTQKVFLRTGERFLEKVIEQAFVKNNYVILKLCDVNSPEEAREYQGALLQIPSLDVWPLPEGRYYFFQIVGLSVFTLGGRLLGSVAEILTTGGNDVYIVKDKNGKEYLIPAIKEVIKKIDLNDKCMVIKPLPGLLGDEESC